MPVNLSSNSQPLTPRHKNFFTAEATEYAEKTFLMENPMSQDLCFPIKTSALSASSAVKNLRALKLLQMGIVRIMIQPKLNDRSFTCELSNILS
jgi:hypothetical protein